MPIKVDYKKELEKAAKNMILLHDPHLLIKMVVRMIIQRVKVTHAGILLHEQERNTYVLTVSGGHRGIKIPAGFARMDTDNAIIRFFRERKHAQLLKDNVLVYKKIQKLISGKKKSPSRSFLKEILHQMDVYETVACIPSYFRNDLLGILLLGKKKNDGNFAQEELNFFLALASDVAMAIRNAQLFKDLQAELGRKQSLFLHTIIALAAAIDAKDHYTHGHTTRVTNISLDIARRLKKNNIASCEGDFMEQLQIAALLHDIGKIGIPESILNKVTPLSDEERRKIREHPDIGVTILQPIKELEEAILGVKYHHERYDGQGYPDGLKGNQIPLIASIIAVADTFDAMTTNRPYHSALSKEAAIGDIKEVSGTQLNPEVAKTLIELYEENLV
jgi:putative nucleotidyltransferase with HDIG domain